MNCKTCNTQMYIDEWNGWQWYCYLCDKHYDKASDEDIKEVKPVNDVIIQNLSKIELNKVYNGDCLELMKNIPDKYIDAIVCDLPYGTTACKWDSIIPFEPLWEQYKRIIKDNGVICLFGDFNFLSEIRFSQKALFRYDIIWKKTRPVGFANANRMPMRIHELIGIFYKKLPTYNKQFLTGFNPYIRKDCNRKQGEVYRKISSRHTTISDGKRFPQSVVEYSNASGEDQTFNRIHPTQKPVKLLEYLVKTYTNENEIVLDNCSGSGSTAIACLNCNRNFICIEKEEKYYTASIERIKKHIEKEKENNS